MSGIGFLLLCGFLIFLSFVFGKDGAIVILFLFAMGLLIWMFQSESKKKESIKAKYSASIAQKILAREYWIGQSREQLRDSLGFPEKIETQETFTKTKEVWKFLYKDSNRIRLKITITNGVVTQIDEK